jgi:hypothetical protein
MALEALEKAPFLANSSSFLTVLSVFFGIQFQNRANRRELSPEREGGIGQGEKDRHRKLVARGSSAYRVNLYAIEKTIG